MAERRMFSRRVIESARFLRMPVSAQALYFHLGMQADDDGVVEGYKVLRMIGANEDDLRVLVAKGFAIVLNEDLVTYLTDWNENNRMRADRKVDSAYRDLLIQMVPDVVLIESKERADRTKGVTAECRDVHSATMGQQWDVPGTSAGQPRDNHGTASGQPWDGIGKDRIGKVSIVQDSNNNTTSAPEPEAPPPAVEFVLNDGTLYGVPQDDVAKYQQLYPGIDVMQELRKIVGWCDANPKNRKTRTGAKRFVNGWLSRAQDKARKPAAAKPANRFHNFNQRNTDYDALLLEEERRMGG